MSIEALVAKVIPDRQVAFTAGSEQGVLEGDIATVYRDEVVKHPETGETLGGFRLPAVRFRINFVADKFSVGQTYELATQEGAGLTLNVSPFPLQTVVRITESEKGEDYRTVLVQVGQAASIVHQTKGESSEGGTPATTQDG